VARLRDDFPDLRYVVFGDGEMEAELRSLAASLEIGENVLFAGYRTDLPRLLPALDVFLFPTLREAMGIALIEAMAAGVPVVATRVGGIPEVVVEGTGVLVSPSDPVGMADQVGRVLRQPALRGSLVEAARERVRSEYSSARMATRTLAVYQAMLARR
jgi:glycosyltransferase involved in cell wall biosynthesis